MNKIAIYCRVSSDDQKERETIENQVDTLETYIEMKDNFTFYEKYLDDGVSGTVAFENRPGGKELISDASKGLFDSILVYKIDRFGRDTLTGLSTIETLRKYNIEIISMTEPFDLNTATGRFQFITYLNMAELERNNILDRMFLGATRAAKKGQWLGGIVPYGYVTNKKFLEIDPDESEIIKKIFDLYSIDKLSSLDIAVYLNNLDIPSSCKEGKGKRTKNITGLWRSSSIQRILKNTTYMGIHEYGKRGTRRKETIFREVPAIISKDQWDICEKQRSINIKVSKRNQKNRQFLLRSLLTCEHCGKNFYGNTYKNRSDVYICSGKRSDNRRVLGIKCSTLNINADYIEELVWNDCEYILKNYDSILSQLRLVDSKSDKSKLNDEISKIKKSLNDKKNEKNNILNIYRKGIITEKEVEDQLKDIKSEEEKINKLLNYLYEKNDIYDNEDKLINDTIKIMEHYYNRLDILSINEKIDIIKILLKSIKVSTVIEDGEKKSVFNIIYSLVRLDVFKDRD
ncbi:recombinase family protein [Clostridium gasigenes]|uniref:recombinase family protein n=1 Tax=Clostridium gasigenes TaxID=94869 RepID=UPI001C0E59CF|nr:recombinase family protein [Clostridium gasigenes]MBU3107184.1 recombinase family protein [Clostridium gasigenes]